MRFALKSVIIAAKFIEKPSKKLFSPSGNHDYSWVTNENCSSKSANNVYIQMHFVRKAVRFFLEAIITLFKVNNVRTGTQLSIISQVCNFFSCTVNQGFFHFMWWNKICGVCLCMLTNVRTSQMGVIIKLRPLILHFYLLNKDSILHINGITDTSNPPGRK